jgi:hypothetical protein
MKMKNSKSVVLGIALLGAGLVQAQETEVRHIEHVVSPAEDVVFEAHHGDALAAAHGRLAAAHEAVSAASARKQMHIAQVGSPGGGAGFLAPKFGFSSAGRTARALVIPKSATDVKELAEIEEDLGVMAHILDKAGSSDDKATRAMGIAVMSHFPGHSTGPQNLYIEGHGAIFLLNVNFPLQPPPAKEDESEAPKTLSNEWEEARRELTAPKRGEAGADALLSFEERYGDEAPWNVKLRSMEYDAEKVVALQKDLITALKNAAHIRQLKADESVTLVVNGAEAGVFTKAFKSGGGGGGGFVKGERVTVKKSSDEHKPAITPAKLIIRARKADCEAFQNGKLDFDAFRKKVTVLMS